MKAELIAVGTELLWGDRVDTNTVTLADALAACGIEVAAKTVVGDDEESLARALSDAMARAPLVILTGGLGITHDDVTIGAIARVAKRRLVLRDDVLAEIRNAYRRRGREAPPASERQALLPVGAEALPNPVGIAPGLRLTEGGAHVVALPGVPAEMRAMFDASVAPWLADLGAGAPIPRRTVHLFGLGELEVDRRLSDLFRDAACETGILASPRGVEIRLRATGKDRATDELDRLVAEIDRRLEDAVYAHDGVPMEAVVGDLLRAKGWTVAVAESCTGGLVGHRLTEVSGSSRYFVGGWVTYANEAKTRWLGVAPEQLAAHGAVSEPVAAMMADGARRAAGSDVALALTGIAGPEGGTPDKPVGTLVVGLADARGTETARWRFSGTRADTKLAFSQFGLNALRRFLARP
ncbi:MAG TPA: competence/damage-inducible protein A [Nitrospiria bacterium]|nr:competence/damage-inducible protein A [Nitrospiria bacterium]